MKRSIRVILLIVVFVFPCHLFAATCTVDSTGTFSGAYTTIDAALDPAACGARGSIIEVYCPGSGCGYGSTTVINRHNILIRSLEGTGAAGAGPVNLFPSYATYAVRIARSRGITFEGFNSYVSNQTAIEVENSRANIVGLPGLSSPRFSTVHAKVGIHASARSSLRLHGIGMVANSLGMRIQSIRGRHPRVRALGVAFLNNAKAVQMDGGAPSGATAGPVLEVIGDYGPVWHNFVFGNTEGFELTGSSRLAMDHTILAGNLRALTTSGTEPYLFDLRDATTLEARNILVYDNDGLPNTGTITPWSEAPFGATNTPGRILHQETSEEVIIEASTFADNQCDTMFHLLDVGPGAGRLTLDHVIVAHSWAKVFSQSSFGATGGCAPITGIGAYLWDNRVDSDPVACMPASVGTTWNPGLIASGAPGTLTGYPAIPGPLGGLYSMPAPFEPISPYPQPSGLYLGTTWSVDGSTPDSDAALDVGYHSPL